MRSLPPLSWLLGLAWLVGCGAAPTPAPAPDVPLAPTPEARAAACQAALDARPDDERQNACYREAMTRLGRIREVYDRLTRAREASPDDPFRWYFEVRARLIHDPSGAAVLAIQCRERLADSPWCVLAEGLAREQAGDLAGALERVALAVERLPVAPALAAEARLRLASGQGLEAVDRLGRALKADNESAEVLVSAALFALAAGDRAEAERTLAGAIQAAPDSAWPLLTRARLHFMVGDLTRAGADLRAALVADDDHLPAREALARLLLDQGKTDAALEHLHLLVDRHPQRSDLMVRLGEALLARGDGQRALGWADLALGAEASGPEALSLRVRALIQLGETEEAAALRAKLYQGEPDARYRIAVARAWAETQRPGRAEAEFAEAVATHPRDPEAWRAFAAFSVRQQRIDRAASLLRRGVEAVPEAAILHADMAMLFELADRLPEAQVAMSQAARLAPDEPDHQDELARLELANEEVHAAIDRWERLLATHPRADRARLRLSMAYRQVGRLDEASQALRTLIETHPEDPALLGQLGEVLMQSGRPAEAIVVLRDALARGGAALAIQPMLAVALADTGAAQEARPTFQAALEADPANRALRMTFARFLERQGDAPAAAALYRAQLARDPTDDEVRQRLVGLGVPKTEEIRWPAARGDAELAALVARVPAGDDPAVVLRDERYVTVDAAGVASLRHQRSVLIQRPVAVERHREMAIGFNATHTPQIVRARTLTPDGVERPLAGTEVRNPNAGTPLHGDARSLVLRFADLEPGAILDYEVVTDRPHPDLVGVWWDGYILANVEPTVRVRYTLDRPVGTPVHTTAPGLAAPRREVRGDREVLEWLGEDLPAFNLGPTLTGSAMGCEARGDCPSRVPAVHVSSMGRWREVDAWYHALFAPQAMPTEALRAQARGLVAGAPDRRARIAALYAHVDRRVQYLGIEFGIGAYQPRPAEATLATGKGDCKDMTALMAALLAAEGIEAYPALLRPRDQGGFDPDHPSPGQFSHVVLYVPDPKGDPQSDLWLDATAGLGTLTAVPTPLRGQTALVVNGRGGKVLRVPGGRPGDHGVARDMTWHLAPNGSGRLEATVRLDGDLAGAARQKLLAIDPGGRQALLTSPGALLGGVLAPQTVRMEGLETPHTPLVLHGVVEDVALAVVGPNGSLWFPFEPGFLTETLPTLGPEAWLGPPRAFEHRLRVVAPPGFTFDWNPLRARHQAAGARVSLEERRDGESTQITSRLVIEREPRDGAARMRMLAELRAALMPLESTLTLAPRQPVDAVALLTARALDRPKDVSVQLGLAHALLRADRPAEVLPIVERLQQVMPEQPALVLLQGLALLKLHRPREAVAPLRRLVARGDADESVYGLLSAALLDQGDAKGALGVLEEVRTRFSFDTLPDLHRQYILTLAKDGQGARAVQEAERFAAREPQDAKRQAFLGDLAADVGQPDVAERAFRRALALEPDSSRVHNNLAWLLRELPARRAEALALATRAVTLNPQSANAWDTLAELRFREGRLDLALEAIERAVQIDPQNPRYREVRARFQSEINK
jgi:tetratricopeptide (TPR) repeat protein